MILLQQQQKTFSDICAIYCKVVEFKQLNIPIKKSILPLFNYFFKNYLTGFLVVLSAVLLIAVDWHLAELVSLARKSADLF